MLRQIETTQARRYPCIDELRRYRSFPCSECRAEGCWMGRKPTPRAAATPLAAGEKACEVCGAPYEVSGKRKYCTDECRKKAVAKQRKGRRSRASQYI